MARTPWGSVLADLAARGWRAQVVDAGRLDEARSRVDGLVASGELSDPVAEEVRADLAFEPPEAAPTPRSVVIGALARPLTLATVVWRGGERTVPIPPHYAGYYATPRRFAEVVDATLRPQGYRAVRCEAPFKTLATWAGLARYGRNNIAYVSGLGSYLQLAACTCDAPPPAGQTWGEPKQLDRCERCSACLRACPTHAIGADRFLLYAERCLTFVNESREPFPEWVEPEWHTCAIGCLRCQQVCPENAPVELAVAAPERFDDEESAAILAADESRPLGAATRAKLERCGLDYAPVIIARNLRALLEG